MNLPSKVMIMVCVPTLCAGLLYWPVYQIVPVECTPLPGHALAKWVIGYVLDQSKQILTPHYALIFCSLQEPVRQENVFFLKKGNVYLSCLSLSLKAKKPVPKLALLLILIVHLGQQSTETYFQWVWITGTDLMKYGLAKYHVMKL